MVWDRERKGLAMFNGQQAIGLTEAQAVEIKIELEKLHFRIGRELTKNALD
jgi:hypothetical protein